MFPLFMEINKSFALHMSSGNFQYSVSFFTCDAAFVASRWKASLPYNPLVANYQSGDLSSSVIWARTLLSSLRIVVLGESGEGI